ncbi:MAG: hypothetical protein OEM15_10395 [Myxococcales bacterium]|nr:hypothetical protein [Myxococcales bacterium]MDH3482907.1 hypothetical protein [Myxococcales bacterium]
MTSTTYPATTGLEELGRGRSGVVYVGVDAEGQPVARKVFGSSGLTKLVQLVFLGAPNPYMWNEHAIRCAHLRREILAKLVDQWFGARLYVARTQGWAWNQGERAFELRTQLVDGRPADLHHPLRAPHHDQASELANDLLPKLQKLLIESGFDGMVWQAGKGNPVALNNFLFDCGENPDTSARWAWIDLESGVPALAALNPLALFGFYVPRSFRFGRPLFDDIDAERLRAYILSDDRFISLIDKVDELAHHQREWKTQPRVARSIGYRLARGDITGEQARWFRARPVRWYSRELGRAVRRAPRTIITRMREELRRLALLPWRRLPTGVVRFLFSQKYRAALARDYGTDRIQAWTDRRQMSVPDAEFLRMHLDREESASFATDFGVHLAIKPFVKGFEYWICPLLYAFGFIGEAGLALLVLTAGPAARSLYTSGRIVQNLFNGRERPWTALTVGALPVVGNFAFPIQILWSSQTEEDVLARFMLYDGFAQVGAHVPIWGGKDTLTEHRLNRMADHIVRLGRSR